MQNFETFSTIPFFVLLSLLNGGLNFSYFNIVEKCDVYPIETSSKSYRFFGIDDVVNATQYHRENPKDNGYSQPVCGKVSPNHDPFVKLLKKEKSNATNTCNTPRNEHPA